MLLNIHLQNHNITAAWYFVAGKSHASLTGAHVTPRAKLQDKCHSSSWSTNLIQNFGRGKKNYFNTKMSTMPQRRLEKTYHFLEESNKVPIYVSSMLLPSEVKNRQEWDSSSSSCAHICIGKGPGKRHDSRATAWAGPRSQWPWPAPLHPFLHDITVKCEHRGLALEKSLSYREDTVLLLVAAFPVFAPRIKLNLVVTNCAHHDELPSSFPVRAHQRSDLSPICIFIWSGFPMELASNHSLQSTNCSMTCQLSGACKVSGSIQFICSI